MLESMSRLLLRLDRRLLAGGLVLVASLAMLGLGLFSILAALGDSGVDLPQEGSIEEIAAQSVTGDGSAAGGAEAVRGPAPVRVSIPRLYLDAPVIVMGLDENRIPQVPQRPDQVAWYDFSATPGRGGNAVFSGHVDWRTRQGDAIPGVFYRLRELEIGDTVELTLEDGTQLQYRVTGNVATLYDDPNVVKAMQATSRDVITLITCGGSWVRDPREALGGNYSHRVVVRAERVEGVVHGNGSAAGG